MLASCVYAKSVDITQECKSCQVWRYRYFEIACYLASIAASISSASSLGIYIDLKH